MLLVLLSYWNLMNQYFASTKFLGHHEFLRFKQNINALTCWIGVCWMNILYSKIVNFSIKIIFLFFKTKNQTPTAYSLLFVQADIQSFFTDLLVLTKLSTQHWIILTDNRSVEEVNFIIRNIIAKHLTTNVISTYPGNV